MRPTNRPSGSHFARRRDIHGQHNRRRRGRDFRGEGRRCGWPRESASAGLSGPGAGDDSLDAGQVAAGRDFDEAALCEGRAGHLGLADADLEEEARAGCEEWRAFGDQTLDELEAVNPSKLLRKVLEAAGKKA